MKLKVKLEGKDEELIFTRAPDGWWEYNNKGELPGNGYAINPKKTTCVTDPWYADYICDAPEHKILSLEEIDDD